MSSALFWFTVYSVTSIMTNFPYLTIFTYILSVLVNGTVVLLWNSFTLPIPIILSPSFSNFRHIVVVQEVLNPYTNIMRNWLSHHFSQTVTLYLNIVLYNMYILLVWDHSLSYNDRSVLLYFYPCDSSGPVSMSVNPTSLAQQATWNCNHIMWHMS